MARLRLHRLQLRAEDLHLGHQIAFVAGQRLLVDLVGEGRGAGPVDHRCAASAADDAVAAVAGRRRQRRRRWWWWRRR